MRGGHGVVTGRCHLGSPAMRTPFILLSSTCRAISSLDAIALSPLFHFLPARGIASGCEQMATGVGGSYPDSILPATMTVTEEEETLPHRAEAAWRGARRSCMEP